MKRRKIEGEMKHKSLNIRRTKNIDFNNKSIRNIKLKKLKFGNSRYIYINFPKLAELKKDLTPKQIETIYLDYIKVYDEIKNEEKNYIIAKENLPRQKTILLDIIKCATKYKSKTLNYGMYGMDPQKAYDEVVNGTREIGHNDMFKVRLIQHRELVLKRGIRKPDQILEDMRTEKTSKNLNGKPPMHEKNTADDYYFYNGTDNGLNPPKTSINL